MCGAISLRQQGCSKECVGCETHWTMFQERGFAAWNTELNIISSVLAFLLLVSEQNGITKSGQYLQHVISKTGSNSLSTLNPCSTASPWPWAEQGYDLLSVAYSWVPVPQEESVFCQSVLLLLFHSFSRLEASHNAVYVPRQTLLRQGTPGPWPPRNRNYQATNLSRKPNPASNPCCTWQGACHQVSFQWRPLSTVNSSWQLPEKSWGRGCQLSRTRLLSLRSCGPLLICCWMSLSLV